MPLMISAVAALESRGVAALLQLALVAVVDQFRQFRLELLQHEGDAVDVLLHLLVITLIGFGDQFVDLAVRHLIEDAIALADGQQDDVEHFVDVGEHLLEVAGRHIGIGPLGQAALLYGSDQAADFVHCGPLRIHTGVCDFAHRCLISLFGLSRTLSDVAHWKCGPLRRACISPGGLIGPCQGR